MATGMATGMATTHIEPAPTATAPAEPPAPAAAVQLAAAVRLDWSGPQHWSDTPGPCRHCETPSHYRDSSDRPAHPSCAEVALAAELFGGGGR